MTVAAMQSLWDSMFCSTSEIDESAFRSTGAVAPSAAVGIYRAGFWIRQHQAMCDLFPRLYGLLGESEFSALSRCYLRENPSLFPALEQRGFALADFVAAQPQWRQFEQLVRVEQALNESLIAPDPTAVAQLQDIQPSTFAEVRFAFVPSFRLVMLDSIAATALVATLPSALEAAAVCTWRPNHRVLAASVSKEEFVLLAAALAGKSVAEIIGHANTGLEHLVPPLKRWYDSQWIESASASGVSDIPGV